jgi:hypothetical protein
LLFRSAIIAGILLLSNDQPQGRGALAASSWRYMFCLFPIFGFDSYQFLSVLTSFDLPEMRKSLFAEFGRHE